MTIIVEDGTIAQANANSYVTLAESDAFHENLGNANWALASDDNKEAALIRGGQYLAQKWRLQWKGSRVQAFQPMDWPRRGVDVPDFFDPFFRQVNVPLQFQDTVFIGENVIPQEVKEAQMLLAVAIIGADGSLASVLQSSLGRKTKREKVGSLEVEYMTAEEGGDTRQTTVYWDAAKRIEPYLRPASPHTGTLVRA